MLKNLNEKGFTITEVIAGIALTGLLTAGFILVLVQFFTTFWELKDYNELQHDLVQTMLYIRNGYPKKTINNDIQMIGLYTAKTAVIESNGKKITIYPNIPDDRNNYWAQFKLFNGKILYSAKFSMINVNSEVIFPKDERLIKKELKFRIIDLNFRKVDSSLNGNVALIEVKITGRVRFRQRLTDQTAADDLRQNTRDAKFVNLIYLGNSQ